MKRGLVQRDPNEISDAEWAGRTTALQAELDRAGLDLALVYGDVFRSDDIGYLTNLCIYWNEGILAVPREGESAFLTKLSPRVQTWMRKVSTVNDLRSGRSFTQLLSEFVADRPAGTVGFVDAALWPAGTLAELREALSGWEVRLLGPVVGARRDAPTAAEVALLRQAGSILAGVIDSAGSDERTMAERVADVELALRSNGFTDVYVHPESASGGLSSLEVFGQYRNLWVCAGRAYADGAGAGGSEAAQIQAALDAAAVAASAAARAGATESVLTGAAREHLAALPADAVATIRSVNQADLNTRGELHAHDEAAPLADGSVVAVFAEVCLADGTSASVVDTVLVTSERGESLTRSGATTSANA
jgi:hypothetical protein